MGKKRKRVQLTQDEIWDDSALLRSWQDAVEEYQFYHSIHAKGEDVEDALRQAGGAEENENENENENAGNEDTRPARSLMDQASPGSVTEDGEVKRQDDVGSGQQAAELADENLPIPSPHLHQPDLPSNQTNTTDVPASSDPSQILENIKMAYWWAGYYSGLYDAKHKGT